MKEDTAMIQGCIFDFDGTLFDSMFIWDTVGSDYLKSIGYVPKADLNRKFKSMSLFQAACYYKSEYGVTLSVNKIIDGVNLMTEHSYREKVKPKNGAETFLRKLKNNGVKMCIATATDRYLVEDVLARHGMGKFFAAIITCADVGHGKDEPHIYEKALNVLGTDKNVTMVFEDAVYAAKTAKADGFYLTGIYDRFEEEQEKLKTLSDIFLYDFTDFESFWKTSSGIMT